MRLNISRTYWHKPCPRPLGCTTHRELTIYNSHFKSLKCASRCYELEPDDRHCAQCHLAMSEFELASTPDQSPEPKSRTESVPAIFASKVGWLP